MAKAIQLVKVDKDYRGLLRAFSKMDDIAKKDMKELLNSQTCFDEIFDF